MSRKNPVFVEYNKYGYIVNINENIKYILHPLEWNICGKLINNKIIPLNENENMLVLKTGLRYQYNSNPSNYWDNVIVSNKNYNEMTIKEIINEVNQRDPSIIKNYINSQNDTDISTNKDSTGIFKNSEAELTPSGVFKNKKTLKLTKLDYLNILNSSQRNNCFYPLIGDDRLVANNLNNWIYYNNYQCWINKNGERCSCISCYRIRDNDEYSILNFKNNHCVYCVCSDCICDNTKFYNNTKEINDNLLPNKCDNCIICKNS